MFGHLSSDQDLEELNSYLSEKSFLSGYSATTVDREVCSMLRSVPSATLYPHVVRWRRHIASYSSDLFAISQEPLNKFIHSTPKEVRLLCMYDACRLARDFVFFRVFSRLCKLNFSLVNLAIFSLIRAGKCGKLLNAKRVSLFEKKYSRALLLEKS